MSHTCGQAALQLMVLILMALQIARTIQCHTDRTQGPHPSVPLTPEKQRHQKLHLPIGTSSYCQVRRLKTSAFPRPNAHMLLPHRGKGWAKPRQLAVHTAAPAEGFFKKQTNRTRYLRGQAARGPGRHHRSLHLAHRHWQKLGSQHFLGDAVAFSPAALSK